MVIEESTKTTEDVDVNAEAARPKEAKQLFTEVYLTEYVPAFSLAAGTTIKIYGSGPGSEYALVKTQDGRELMIDKKVLADLYKKEADRMVVIPAGNLIPDFLKERGLKVGQRLILGDKSEGCNLRTALTENGIQIEVSEEVMGALRGEVI